MNDGVAWDPPGPGSWELDRSHYASPMTPIAYALARHGMEEAYRDGFASAGVPAAGIELANVNGFAYSRVRPLFGADRDPARPPPERLVRLLGRLHPEMRRRERRAAARLADPDFRRTLDEWRTTLRPTVIARNRELQAIDPGGLDDPDLAVHVDRLLRHASESAVLHHRLHIDDLGPLGLFVVFCRDRGIDTEDALEALTGASPSTVEPRRDLAAIRAELDRHGATPRSLEEIRRVSEAAAALLDTYLDRHGAVLFSGYDIDTPTLAERPDIVMATIMHSSSPTTTTSPPANARAETAGATLRNRIATEDHAAFDRALTDAREAMDLRDDNGPLTVEWPAGLLRLGLLEVGRRLTARKGTHDPDHVFELTPDEVGPLLVDGAGPGSDELAVRAARRAACRSLDPPPILGQPPQSPPLHLLPPAMATALDMVTTVIGALFGAPSDARAPLTGTGIGTVGHEGTARVAETAEEAIAMMQPGDVLVTRATSPAFNLVLSTAGGLVTVHGGPMSHAAVLSRELGLPAVIGVADCLDHISTGDTVVVDPVRGVVSIR